MPHPVDGDDGTESGHCAVLEIQVHDPPEQTHGQDSFGIVDHAVVGRKELEHHVYEDVDGETDHGSGGKPPSGIPRVFLVHHCAVLPHPRHLPLHGTYAADEIAQNPKTLTMDTKVPL